MYQSAGVFSFGVRSNRSRSTATPQQLTGGHAPPQTFSQRVSVGPAMFDKQVPLEPFPPPYITHENFLRGDGYGSAGNFVFASGRRRRDLTRQDAAAARRS